MADKINQRPYTPFLPLEGVYDDVDSGILVERALVGMETVFGFPRRMVDRKFRDFLTGMLKRKGRRLHCSTARAVLEGRIPGVPRPITEVPQAVKDKLLLSLALLDLMETAVGEWLEGEIVRVSPLVSEDLKAIREAHGNLRLPGLLEAFYAVRDQTAEEKTQDIKQTRQPRAEKKK